MGRRTILATLVALAIVTFGFFLLEPLQKPAGSAQLVSIQQLPDVGEMCLLEPSQADSSPDTNLFASLNETSVYAQQTVEVNRPPVRYIRDLDPIYSYVAVDTRRNEVFMQDTNTWSIRVFNRLDNTPPTEPRTNPKRLIGGPKTETPLQSA
jgi:hypothetical protein